MHLEKKYLPSEPTETILSRIEGIQARKEHFKKMNAPSVITEGMDNEIQALWDHYNKGTRYIHDIDEMEEVLDYDDEYEDITSEYSEDRKKELAIEHFGKEWVDENWDKEGLCIHCDKRYVFKDSKVVKSKLTDDIYILCPHDQCDGSYLDFVDRK